MYQARYREKEFYRGAIYHVYNRGVAKNPIFFDEQDLVYYLLKMREFKDKYGVDVMAYSLLDNHYHQLLQQLSKIPINKFLLAVNTSYGQYFNRKYKRIGPLMQDRYKQVVVGDDNDFVGGADGAYAPPLDAARGVTSAFDVGPLGMSVYVNCNFEIHGLGKARDYKWSSYRDYLGLRNGTLCNKEKIERCFRTPKEYEVYCDELILAFRRERE